MSLLGSSVRRRQQPDDFTLFESLVLWGLVLVAVAGTGCAVYVLAVLLQW